MKGLLPAAALALLAPMSAQAKDIVVQMKNQGAAGAMVFEPAFIKAMPGDTVRFVPTDPAHNAETIANMLPAGVAPTKGMMNKEFVLKVTAPGLYGVKCQPHYSMGMVALVQVGNGPSANLAAAKAVKLAPFAARRMTPLLDKANDGRTIMASFIVTYPAREGARFDADYYVTTHMAIVRDRWTPYGLTSAVALMPDAPDPGYLAIAVLEFESAEARARCFAAPEAADIFGDVANFTDLAPVAMTCAAR